MTMWLLRCPSLTAMPTILRTTLTLLLPRFDGNLCAVECMHCHRINTDAADHQHKETKFSLSSTNVNPLYRLHYIDPALKQQY